MMRLAVQLTGKNICWRLPFDLQEGRIALQSMTEAVLRVDAELDLHLACDAEMAVLNQTHMRCHGPTNVLSFPAVRSWFSGLPERSGLPELSGLPERSEPPAGSVFSRISEGHTLPLGSLIPPGLVYLGSLVLCVDVLDRECLLYGQPKKEHCLRLLAHGMGHLLGYEHGAKMDSVCEKMQERAETALLRA